MHTVWPEVRSSRIPARVKTRTSSDHRGGYRARSPAAGALRRLLVCMDYTSMWSFDMSIIFSFSFTFGCPSCSGPGLCHFFLKKNIICIFCEGCSVSLSSVSSSAGSSSIVVIGLWALRGVSQSQSHCWVYLALEGRSWLVGKLFSTS